MRNSTLLILFTSFVSTCLTAQDSMWVRLRPAYDKPGSMHRFFFGENYRKEWADSTKLPVLHLDRVDGGLKPVRLGGGHQTVSLRLASASGREWVLRRIEKDASVVLPFELRQTFAREVIDDAMSAQHPFSPLVVTALAEAANVPHAKPVIGVVRNDTFLGEHSKRFAGVVCLLEEREPMGNSTNSLKMFADLDEDNDNGIDGRAFLRARLLDLLIGDWDRHPDQWRWVDTRKGKSKLYVGIPRDRDQALYVNEGVFPGLASRPWFVPSLQGFNRKIRQVKYSLKEGAFMHSRPAMHISYDEWMSITKEFTAALTDSVISSALQRLPQPSLNRRYTKLFGALKSRRDRIPAAMKEYYHFINRVADLQLSDKHELISIESISDTALSLRVEKNGKGDKNTTILENVYDPSITRELRIYTGNGNDTVMVDNRTPIRIRIIANEGSKSVWVAESAKKIRLYNKNSDVVYHGNESRLMIRRSDDSLHTAYVPTNRYNILKPLIGAGYNRDDGFLLGLGVQYIHQGFRKTPYAGMNRLMLYHSFATSAFKIRYSSEWIKVIGKADVVAAVDILAPQNTQNYFGRGNETPFVKSGDFIRFYRTRFNLYQVTTGLRWQNSRGLSFVVGPSLQHYRFDSIENKGRFLANGRFIHSYDSNTLAKSKTHAGLVMNLLVNKRNNKVIPTSGYQLLVKLQGFGGLNKYSESFVRLVPEFSVYLPVNKKRSFVIANRIGGGLSLGKMAFYQSLFAGGQENLLGYRQYRFAGEHVLYNNLEARLRLANFTGYILPGEFGMLGFYDVGRVWTRNEQSKIWHHGTGGGIYFAPAKLAVLSVVAGYSKEGWYPYITVGFRF